LAGLVAKLPDIVKHLETVQTSCDANLVAEVGLKLSAPSVPYKCGVVEVPSSSPDIHVEAYLQPSGGFCWSNAGTIVIGGTTLIIDSVTSVPLQVSFNKQSRAIQADKSCKDCLFILSHPDVDHFYGISAITANRSLMHATAAPKVDAQLAAVPGMKIKVAAGVVAGNAIEKLAALSGRDIPAALQPVVAKTGISRKVARFGFEDLAVEWPARIERSTFTEREKEVVAGVTMICPGGIHSNMDCWILCEDARVVFAGDLLFVGMTPLMWRGDMKAWIAALDEMLERTAADPDDWHYVPGHGPVVKREMVQLVHDYWVWAAAAISALCPSSTEADARQCTKALLSQLPEAYSTWLEKERLLASVYVELYIRSRGGENPSLVIQDKLKLFADIAALEKELQ